MEHENEIIRRLDLIEERLSNQTSRTNRLESHFDSESGLSRERGLRVDSIEKTVEILDKIIRNGGAGLNVRVDRLEQARHGSRGRWSFFFSLAALILTLLSIIINYLK